MKVRGVMQKLTRSGYVVVEANGVYEARKENVAHVYRFTAVGTEVKRVTAVNHKGETYDAASLGAATRFVANHLNEKERTHQDWLERHAARVELLAGRAARRAARIARKAVEVPSSEPAPAMQPTA